jgi:5'-nucleotidase
VRGVEVTSLGKRIYRDELTLEDQQGDGSRRLYRIYGQDIGYQEEAGTDLAAVAGGRIAVTPIHFDLTDREGMDALEVADLARLLRPAAHEVE